MVSNVKMGWLDGCPFLYLRLDGRPLWFTAASPLKYAGRGFIWLASADDESLPLAASERVINEAGETFEAKWSDDPALVKACREFVEISNDAKRAKNLKVYRRPRK